MRRPPIRHLDLAGSPEAMGDVHGRAHGAEIRRYAHDRVELVAEGLWSGGPLERGAVLELAEACLPAHEAFSPRLHAEMLAMASAAGITPAEAVAVGGFTDFVDTVRAATGGPASGHGDGGRLHRLRGARREGLAARGCWARPGTCTTPPPTTWCWPACAPTTGPDALVFTTVGCLGQIGMNAAGVCVGHQQPDRQRRPLRGDVAHRHPRDARPKPPRPRLWTCCCEPTWPAPTTT